VRQSTREHGLLYAIEHRGGGLGLSDKSGHGSVIDVSDS
jgi:hypothetical protein